MSGITLAVGADGKFAGLVIPALAARGAKVRGLVRKPGSAAEVRDKGAVEVAIGDLSDPASMARALEGVTSVFYIAPAFLPNEAQVGKAMVAAAIKAGVRRFVFSSVIHPVLSGLPNHALKAPVEEAILDSDLDYTFLHPTLFFQNYAGSWGRVMETGVLAEPWSNDTRFSRVDYRDVAEVAAIALTEDRLLAGTFELCAPGLANRHEVAALASEVLGRAVKAQRVDPATLGPEAAPMRPMFDHYERFGLKGNALTLTAILGREPRTLRGYFEELARAPAAVARR
ncbi:MAG: NmrA family NAD(P)-binding protein [Burkholderiaceae bacterium]